MKIQVKGFLPADGIQRDKGTYYFQDYRNDFKMEIWLDTALQSLQDYLADADFFEECDLLDEDGKKIVEVRLNPKPYKFEKEWSNLLNEPVYFGKYKPKILIKQTLF